MEKSTVNLARYHRQMIFYGIGEAGQRRLLASSVVIIGCGATGSVLASHLVRAGVGNLRLVDRDYIELSNLQRQSLFDEDDLAAGLPKAIAAERKLRKVNSEIKIEGVVGDFNSGNALELLRDADLILDGADNFETRYLLNDACLKLGLPWVYTGVVASYGMTATFVPDGAAKRVGRSATSCLQCVFGEQPVVGGPTCDTVGVLGSVVSVLASISANEAIKLLTGNGEINRGMIHVDLWDNTFAVFQLADRNPTCPACGQADYRFLTGQVGSQSVVLCGRDAVQVRVTHGSLDMAALAEHLAALGDVRLTPYLLRARIDSYEMTLFPDGRAIIKGTDNPDVARSLYRAMSGI